MMSLFSSASLVPEKPPSLQILTASLSVMTSTSGLIQVFSTLKEAATPSASTSLPRRNPISTTPSDMVLFLKMSSTAP